MQNIFRIPSFTICFFIFLVYLTFFFLFYLSMVSKKIVKFLFCFIVWIRDFIKKFCKTMVFLFNKNWDIWNPKFQQNFIVYYFFFIFSVFLAFCFLFHLSKLVQKLWNFCSILLEGLEILPTISEKF